MLILMYHGFGRRTALEDPDNLYVRREMLEQQLRRLLRRGWRPADPESLRPWHRFDGGRREFLVTIDDGYVDTSTIAAPVLGALGVPAVCFVLPGLLGASASWKCGAHERLMTASQVRALPSQGISVGSHSWRHERLTELEAVALRADLHRSADALEELMGTRPRLFAHPFGSHDQQVRRAVATTGVTHAFATSTSEPGPLSIPRVDVNSLDNSATMVLKRSPHYARMRLLTDRTPSARAGLRRALAPGRA